MIFFKNAFPAVSLAFPAITPPFKLSPKCFSSHYKTQKIQKMIKKHQNTFPAAPLAFPLAPLFIKKRGFFCSVFGDPNRSLF
jgi:hypothetical protein